MFTGLIEAIGSIANIQTTPDGSRMAIETPEAFLKSAQLGDSIAIDGVCTTVVALTKSGLSIEASPETLAKTTFSDFKVGKKINLERPLTPQSRIGGHFVSGHVDGTASILARFEDGNSVIYRFLLNNADLAPYLIEKGSVTVNGISLTVNTVQGPAFSVAIIPHTLQHTSLGDYGVDDTVNIETDILGKYVAKLLQSSLLKSGSDGDRIDVSKSKLYGGQWFCHDEAIHGDIKPLISQWPEKP